MNKYLLTIAIILALTSASSIKEKLS